ncbi:MAG: hypothetical protein QNJ30_10315 [Kiloniellales bacterium]|nr:hypothetical protein [Kiloniellales bacterium]
MLENQSISAERRRLALSGWLIPTLLFAALFPLTLSGFAYTIVDNHWLGSEAAYDYWAANDFQWGTEIVQNIGPLGYIHFPLSFTGFLDLENAWANFVQSGTLVVLVIYLAWMIPNRLLKTVFLTVFVLMQVLKQPYVFSFPTEVSHYLLALFIAYALFNLERYFALIPLVILLAGMSLGKGMYLFIAPVIIFFAALFYILRRKVLLSIAGVSLYVLSFLFFWVSSGQEISNLPDFIWGSLAFSSGYSEALANYSSSPLEGPSVISTGSALFHFAIFISLILLVLAKNFYPIKTMNRVTFAAGLMLASIELLILFAVWKHGIVSSDIYHISVFFWFACVSVVPFLCVHHAAYYQELRGPAEIPGQRRLAPIIGHLVNLAARVWANWQRRADTQQGTGVFAALIRFGDTLKTWLGTAISQEKHQVNASETSPPAAFGFRAARKEILVLIVVICLTPNFFYGWKFVLFLEGEIAAWNDKLAASVAEMQMPQTREVVGKERVGYFGELPAPMVYNDFLYTASPSTISFAGWNPWIIEKDADFFRNAGSAPPYLVYQLFNTQAIVRQFSPLDSPKAQLEIFRRYDPVLASDNKPIHEHGRLLLKRREPSSALRYEDLGQWTEEMGDWIQVPGNADGPVQTVIRLPTSLATKILTAIYKAPGYSFEYKLDDGTLGKRKFTPTKGREGFLLAPLILKNRDLLAALSAEEWEKYLKNDDSALRRITQFRINCEHITMACATEMEVRFNEVLGLEFGRNADHR